MLRGLQRALSTYQEQAAKENHSVLVDVLSEIEAALAALENGVAETIVLTMADGEPVAGRSESSRWWRVRNVPLRHLLVGLLSARVVPGVEAALDRLRELHYHGLDGVDGLIAGTLWLTLEGPTEEPVDWTRSKVAFEVRLQCWHEREEERLRGESRQMVLLANQVAAEVAGFLRSPRLSLPHFGGRAPGTPALDVETQAERQRQGFDLQGLLLARTRLDLSMQSMQSMQLLLRESADVLRSRLENTVRHVALAKLKTQTELIDEFADRVSLDPTVQFDVPAPSTLQLDEQALLDGLLDAIGKSVAGLPENLELLGDVAFQHLEEGHLEEVEPITIDVRRLVRFLLETDLVGSVREDLTRLSQALARSANTMPEVHRVISDDDLHEASSSEREAMVEERVELLRSSALTKTDPLVLIKTDPSQIPAAHLFVSPIFRGDLAKSSVWRMCRMPV
jgi:hypothetical protein